MLPPTAARASVSLSEKPAPQSWREKMLGTWVCFTRESKKGSRLSSGWREEKSRGRAGMCQCCPFCRGSACLGEDTQELSSRWDPRNHISARC